MEHIARGLEDPAFLAVGGDFRHLGRIDPRLAQRIVDAHPLRRVEGGVVAGEERECGDGPACKQLLRHVPGRLSLAQYNARPGQIRFREDEDRAGCDS